MDFVFVYMGHFQTILSNNGIDIFEKKIILILWIWMLCMYIGYYGKHQCAIAKLNIVY